MDTKLLKPKEVAEKLQLNLLTIYGYIRSGELKAVKFGRTYRVEHADLLSFVENHEVIVK